MVDSSESAEWKNPEPEQINEILAGAKTIAVVGLSSKPERPSYGVANYLMAQGFRVIPVNPMEKEILGQKSYPDLSSIDEDIDIVDIFRKGETTPPIVEEAIRVGAKCVWMQEGVISIESHRLASNAGIPVVMNKCILKEHKRSGV